MSVDESAFTVYKLDHNGREVWRYLARVLERSPHHIRLEAFFNRDDMDLGYAVFKRGDRFIETFYSDRWYNVFAVYDREGGALKGWYGNVCRPAKITEMAVRCDDLALDVWVTPEGELVKLDEEEFAALPLRNEERAEGLAAVRELEHLATSGRLPR
jgi:predicted RNA-binding protein associated with RNAse of E/G family